MADIVDIIHELSFKADTSGLSQVQQQFVAQINQIAQLQTRLQTLENIKAKTAADDAKRLERVNSLIAQQTELIEAATTALGEQYAQSTELQSLVAKQASGLQDYQARLHALAQARERAFSAGDTQKVAMLDRQLSAMRLTMQQYTGTAGATAGAVNKLGNAQFAFQQILREGPAFTYSFQMGLMAISNNIPILVDELGRAKAAGSSTRDILLSLGKSLFSFGSLVTITLSVLSIFGDRLFNMGKGAESAKDALDELNKTIANTANAGRQGIQNAQRELNFLIQIARSGTAEQQAKAIEQLEQKYGDLGKQAVTSADALQQLNGQVAAAEKSRTASKWAQDIADALAAADPRLDQAGKALEAAQARADAANARFKALSGPNYDASAYGAAKTAADNANEALEDARMAYQGISTEVAKLKKNLQQAEQAQIEFGKQAGIALFGPEQEKKGREKRITDISDQLRREITALNKEIESINLSGEQQQEETLRKRIENERQAALEELNIRIDHARKAGQLNATTAALFAQIQHLTNEKFNAQLEQDLKEFYDRLKQQHEEFFISLQKAELEDSRARLRLQQELGQDTYATRKAILERETLLELQENSRRYDEALKTAQEIGADVTLIEQQFQERQQQIFEQRRRNEIVLEEEYLRDRLNVLQTMNRQEVEELQAHAAEIITLLQGEYEAGAIGYRRYRRERARIGYDADREELRQNRDNLARQVEEAQRSLDAIILTPHVDDQEVKDAIERLNQLIRKYEEANNQFLSTAPQGSRGFEFVFGDTARIANPEERRQEAIQKSIQAYQALEQTAVQALSAIYDAQVRSLDQEISIRERRVEEAKKLAERGNTEALRLEEDRLTKAVKLREEYANRQVIINAALALSNAILAVATAAGETGPGAIAVVPAVVAAIAAGYGLVTAATTSASTPGFKDGVIDLQGPGTSKSDSISARLSVGESVMTAEETKLYKPWLLAMRNRTFPTLDAANMHVETVQGEGVSRKEFDKLGKKLDAVVEAVEGIHINARQTVDSDGLTQYVERAGKNTRRSFS